MAQTIVIKDLSNLRNITTKASRTICGSGIASSFLFRSASRQLPTAVYLNIGNFEVNNYEITNNIDQLISQTNNQLQLSMINVEAGDAAKISIASDQGLSGSNNSSL